MPTPTHQYFKPLGHNPGDLYLPARPPQTSTEKDDLWPHPSLHQAPTSTIVSPPRSPSRFSDTPALQAPLTLTKPTTVQSHHNQDGFGHAENWHSPTNEEMNHLCRFFVANLLVHIPILAEHDVGEYDMMVEKKKRPLACAMVYIAARYVPGCKAIQTMLLPDILSILKPLAEDCDEATRWTTLQAFAVLYNWALPPDLMAHAEPPGSDSVLNDDTLSVLMKTLIRQCSLHKAAEELALVLYQSQNDVDVRQTFAFRRYLFWLWLFGEVHFRSLCARSPPSIQPDSAIRSCRRLLRSYTHDDKVRRILAQAELCLIWDQPTRHEWWCSMPSENDLEATLAVLKEMDEALEGWRRTWFPPEQARSDKSHSLDFQYCFSRFCVSAYVTKLYQTSTSAKSSPLLSLSLVTKSIERTSQSSRLFLSLPPLSKSGVRFAPEGTFGMLALGAHYVLRAHGLLADVDIVKPSQLNIIHSLAELMVDLSMDSKHSARIYGESLLRGLPVQLQAANPSTPSLNAMLSQQPAMQSPEVERTTSATSMAWTLANTVNPGLTESRPLFHLVSAVDEVWPLSATSLRYEQATEQRPALWTTGESSRSASQHHLAVAPNITNGIGLGLNYNGCGPLVYAAAVEGMSCPT